MYACRHCHKLAYSTQREDAGERADSRAETIRKRLGWAAGILNGNGGMPKGMHWATFMRLQAAHNAHVNQSPAGMSAKLGLVMGRLGHIKILRGSHVSLIGWRHARIRIHKPTVKGADNRVFENKRYDGTLPGQAQTYLANVWCRIRAKLARQGIRLYGFRIAEPNHDGTPHWHLLVFAPSEKLADLQATVWKYALQDSPKEPGASTHRVDFKPIDAGKGTAAGYIAKYVAKNIDGFKLDTDLYGNDGVTASHRVEAWAATWRIRQFQQIGGAPVGPWRELHRVKNLPSGAPQHLIDAHHAVNKITDMEAGTIKPVSWAQYTQAQGGVYCGRNARIKISTIQPDGMNRYGEKAAKRSIGIETVNFEQYRPEWNPGLVATRSVHWIVESERHVWQVASRGANPNPPAASRPWTCVNNCTVPQTLRRTPAKSNVVNRPWVSQEITAKKRASFTTTPHGRHSEKRNYKDHPFTILALKNGSLYSD